MQLSVGIIDVVLKSVGFSAHVSTVYSVYVFAQGTIQIEFCQQPN